MNGPAVFVRTPADLTVIATCPTCEQTTGIRIAIGAELLVSDEGSELRLKARSKGVAHICAGQRVQHDDAEDGDDEGREQAAHEGH